MAKLKIKDDPKQGQGQPEYSEEEKEFRSRIYFEMERAKDQRSADFPEFDDMDYVTYWESNAKAANSYIPPKTDDQDVRTTSGTTLEKKNTLLTSILNLSLEPDVEAFDQNDEELEELGTVMEDLIRKSREIEDYDQKKVRIYDELLTQGTVFVEEQYKEFRLPQKEVESYDFRELMCILEISGSQTCRNSPTLRLGDF
jgi:hypothetical protein